VSTKWIGGQSKFLLAIVPMAWVIGACATALLVSAAGPAPVVLALGAAACVWAMLLWPDVATATALFLLYANAPAVATIHGVPKVIAGSVVLLLFVPLIHRLIVGRGRAVLDTTFALMVAFLCVMLLASLAAPDKRLAVDRLVTYLTEGLVLYWLIVNVLRTKVQLRRAIAAVLAAGVLLGTLSIYQYATKSYDNQFGGFAERKLQFEYKRERDAAAGIADGRLYRADRAEGPQVGNNRYAQIMLVLLPLAVLKLRRAQAPGLRIQAAAAGGVIFFGGVLLTYSRGGLLGAAVVLIGAAAIRWLPWRHLLVAFLICGLALPIVSPNVYSRISSLNQIASLSDPSTDGALRGRATEMLASLHAFADHPLLGVGPGQYAPIYSVEYQQLPGVKFRDIQKGRRAHSLYFEMAAETGLLGLVVFLMIPIVVLRRLWRAVRANPDAEVAETAAALCLSLIGFLFTALFLSHAFERYYWILIGLAGATLTIANGNVAKPSSIGPEDGAAVRPATRTEIR
jgi:putative inorganic carbon (hco3(-)) transporter